MEGVMNHFIEDYVERRNQTRQDTYLSWISPEGCANDNLTLKYLQGI